MIIKRYILIAAIICLANCGQQSNSQSPFPPSKNTKPPLSVTQFDSTTKTIHVLVALCDNKYQGIVPVPAAIGNGQNPATNLYWGCAFGVKSYFNKSANWQFIKRYQVNSTILERVVFKHKQSGWYLVADAYDGRSIRQCTVDFFKSCAGIIKDTVQANNKDIGSYGNARLLAYVGHDGLMDFSLSEQFKNVDGKPRDAIMLACISKRYFAPHLQPTKANPLVWSTGLMSPEAYTLHDALESYLRKETPQNIRTSAAKAYAKYQHCSIGAASRLLVTGY